VCNACAFNAGRSLCVQISRERSYPLPIPLTQYRGVTDRQTDGQTDGIAVASTSLAMRALRRAVKMMCAKTAVECLHMCKRVTQVDNLAK